MSLFVLAATDQMGAHQNEYRDSIVMQTSSKGLLFLNAQLKKCKFDTICHDQKIVDLILMR